MALDVQALMAECPAPDGGTLSLRIGLHVVGRCRFKPAETRVESASDL